MAYVLDASVAAAWFFPDEDAAAVQMTVERLKTDIALVPMQFWFEIRNLLVIGERRGRNAPAESTLFLARLDNLPIEADRAPVSADVLSLARSHALSVHDAAYLELARRRGAVLATLDRRLAAAARSERLTVLAAS